MLKSDFRPIFYALDPLISSLVQAYKWVLVYKLNKNYCLFLHVGQDLFEKLFFTNIYITYSIILSLL